MKIGILGTGTMGTVLAKNLLKAGREIIVYDRTMSKTEPLVALGAKAVPSAAQAVDEANVIITVVIDGKAVREVLLNEETHRVLKGKKILNVATTNATEIESIADDIIKAGGSMAEVSIVGYAQQILDNEAYFMLGCNESDKLFWEEILKDLGESYYVGKVGDASRAEAPMIFAATFMSMTSIFSVATALKLNLPEQVVLKQLSLFGPGTEYMVPALLARDYSHGVATLDGYKDTINILIKTAKSANLPTKVLEEIVNLYEEASKMGLGNKAETAVLEAFLNHPSK